MQHCSLKILGAYRFFSKNESAGIAASIDAMTAGEDGPEVPRNGSKIAADGSPSVRW